MKAIFKTIIFLAAVSVSACKKEAAEPSASEKKIELKMNVDKASLQAEPGSLPFGGINQLTYVVFKASTTQRSEEVARITQHAGDPNFGSHTFSLAPGSYKSVVVGSKATFEVPTSASKIYENAEIVYPQSPDLSEYKTDDTFLAKQDFVFDGTQAIYYSLTRIVGKIELKVTSPTPYTVKIKNEATRYQVLHNLSGGVIEVPYVKTIENPAAHNEILILRTDRPLQLELSAGGVTKELTVDVRKNKRTIIQGTLNSLSAHIPLSAVLNDEWSSETTEIDF